MKSILSTIAIVFTLFIYGQENSIVFTTNPSINLQPLNKNEIKNTFSKKENIYAVIISKNKLKELIPNDQEYFWLHTKKLPKLKDIRFRTLPEYCLPEEKYFIFPVMLQEDEKEYFSNDSFEVMQHFSELPVGKNKIEVQLKEGGNVKFSGSFTLDISEQKDMFTNAKKMNPNKRKGKGYLKFGMKHSDIEYEILTLFQETYPEKGFKKVIITSKKYYYKRDEEYNVIARFLDADILVNNAGKCRAYDVTVKQDKIGQNYGVLEEVKVNGFYVVDCQGW